MGLGFIVPAFLAGLAALAVPIILHLRHRDKDRPEKFPSLMFLEQLPIRTSERRRITDWPLLLLRALALSLIVIAFARPVFSGKAADEVAKRSRAVVLLLDRSMSMSHKDVWKAATDSARAVIASLGAGDRVALVLFDDEAEIAQPFTVDKAAATAALAKATPTHRATKYAAALRAARQLVARAGDAKAEVVSITDLQQTGVQGVAGLDLPAGLSVRTVGVGTRDRSNTTISSVEIHRLAEANRTMLSVQARVLGREVPTQRNVHAVLTLNGRESGARDAVVPSTGDVVVPFAPVLLPAGQVRGMVTITNDNLAADDTFHFAFTADDAIHLLLVAPEDAAPSETMYFEHALAVGKAPMVKIERVRASSLTSSELMKASMVVLWDVPLPAGNVGKALTEWVRGGGGVVFAPGRRALARVAANTLVSASIDGSAERMADHGGSLGDVRFDHPLFSPFRETPAALSAARFLRYVKLAPLPGTDVLARFDDGLPAVLEHREGLGRVVVLALALDARTGDFPVQSAYLPFLQRLTLYTSGRDATTLWRSAGQSWLLPGSLREPAVLTPSGSIVRPARDSVGSTVALREAGVYALYEGRVQGEPAGLVAVNAPASESDLTAVDAKELLLGVHQTAADSSSATDAPTTAEVESRQRMWRLLLIAAFLLLVGETVFGNHGWRGTASKLTVTPSDGSAS